MAIDNPSDKLSMLDPGRSRIAAALAVVAALAAMAAAGASMLAVGLSGWRLAAMAAAALALVAGVNLMMGRIWAQQLLLVVFLAVAAGSLMGVLGIAAYGMPQWLADAGPVQAWALLTVPMALSALAAGALVWASLYRLRYASYVELSIAAAAALLVVVNVISHKEPYRQSIETLTQYRLSDRTKLILDAVKEPIRITAVYRTGERKDSDEQKAYPDEFRQRVVELLEEMHQYNLNVEVRDASRDADKAQVLERLRRQMGSAAEAHERLLNEFQAKAPLLLEMLSAQQARWSQLPERSYLNMWAGVAQVPVQLQEDLQAIQQALAKVRRSLAGSGLPDYAALTQEVGEVLDNAEQDLRSVQTWVKRLQAVPAQAGAARQQVLDALKAAQASAEELGRIAAQAPPSGATTAPAASAATTAPADLAARALSAMRDLANKVSQAADAIAEAGGKDGAGLIQQFMPLSTRVSTPQGRVRMPLGAYLHLRAVSIDQQADEVEQTLKLVKAEYAGDLLSMISRVARDMTTEMAQAHQTSATALELLSTVDDASGAIISAAAGDKLFEEPLAAMSPLAEQAKSLPEIKEQGLAGELSRDNLVIIEAAGKVQVVDFDQVWPVRVQAQPPGADVSELSRRTFNGDSAIASRILSMTQKPFGRVLLAHVQPDPRTMQMLMMQGNYSALPLPASFSTLRKRLEEANFQVAEWDLSKDMPQFDAEGKPIEDEHQDEPDGPAATASPQSGKTSAPATQAGGMPTVVLVLPTMQDMMMPLAMTEEHVERIAKAIDGGAGAIFLTQYSGPSIELALKGYLRRAWGIEPQSTYRLIAGVPDQAVPGRYKIDLMRSYYMPLTGYTDHPIVKPLQSQRTLWTDVCPVVPANARCAGVSLAQLLCVEKGQPFWAASNIRELAYKIQVAGGGYVTPNFGGDDLAGPFSVALAAQRTPDPESDTPEARIVVLGMGPSLMDSYLTQQVVNVEPAISYEPPPAANADLVINSAYWAIRQEPRIAAGPAITKPLAMIPGKDTLWVLCTILVPMAIAAAGAMVMLMRRR